MALPAVYDLAIYRGDSDAWRFSFWEDEAQTEPVDLTGWTPTAQIRAKPDAPTVLATLTCAIVAPNIVDVNLTADESAGLSPCSGAWDLQLVNGSSVRTMVAGRARVVADVTLPEAPP